MLISFVLTVGGLLLTLYNYFFFNYPFLNQTTVGLIVSFLIVSLIFLVLIIEIGIDFLNYLRIKRKKLQKKFFEFIF